MTATELRASIAVIVAGEVAAGSWPDWGPARVRAEVLGRLARMRRLGYVERSELPPLAPVQRELFP